MHPHYNYNRRNSSATPYPIPKVSQQHQNGSHSPGSNGFHTGGPISSSVPSLSREFVVRRISEGESGRLKEELKCEACGKGYKHVSSLAKHLWEHTPEWNMTKRLSISKHQQVQLLEAASILVGMNDGGQSSSRRNSVFVDESGPEDPKYASPFSPNYSGETSNSSNAPTPPEQVTSGKVRFKFPSHDDRSTTQDGKQLGPQFKTERMLSVSQEPPSTTDKESNPLSMPSGYLDIKNQASALNSGRSLSISNDTQAPAKSILKSPNWSESKNNTSPPSSPLDDDSEGNASPKQNDDEDESIIGKME
ncbi:Piso0_004808 [Millerozyma farinosa CBS 7064]|uniref:Piso0_004808 protein n=1 Tax=Pichia sorbitophila (strain ATCC MYA-4447 / BCRC 22081 / CBS 7064 / NBRC 10061 / NRRL Y-12695) TaxID=559304 RepID=G8Y0H2_PICSO|nr:Piso0_004808 [Millerozyma farinosa CBS 7064]